MDGRRRCLGITPGGAPCGALPLHGGDYCLFHDPQAQQRAAAVRYRGGKGTARRERARKLREAGVETLADLDRLLMAALVDVHAGRLDVEIYRAMCTGARVIRDLHVGVELEERVGEIQRQTGDLAEKVGAA